MVFARSKTSGRTTVKNVKITTEADVEIDIKDVKGWLDKATVAELEELEITKWEDLEANEENEPNDCNVKINCGDDPTSQFDPAQVQAILGTLHVQDILDKLRA